MRELEMRHREREQRVKQSGTSQPRSIRHNWTRTTMKLLLLVSFLSLWRRSDGTGEKRNGDRERVCLCEGVCVLLCCSGKQLGGEEAHTYMKVSLMVLISSVFALPSHIVVLLSLK